MNKYKIVWTNCGEEQISYKKAYDCEDAEEKFWDSILEWQGDSRGIEIISISKVSPLKKRIADFYK